MDVKKLVIPVVVVMSFIASPKGPALGPFQEEPREAQSIQPEEIRVIDSLNGRVLFQEYCASCHGLDAKGNGPAAPSLKKHPSDLTRIREENDGLFPMVRVQKIISGEEIGTTAHGNREMPVWGPIFGQIAWDQDLRKVRIYNLAKYLESLQRN